MQRSSQTAAFARTGSKRQRIAYNPSRRRQQPTPTDARRQARVNRLRWEVVVSSQSLTDEELHDAAAAWWLLLLLGLIGIAAGVVVLVKRAAASRRWP
jgi:hypothetical protein